MKLTAFFIFHFFVAVGAARAEAMQRFRYAQERFSIDLPANWKEIPKSILDSHARALLKGLPAGKQRIVHGYQLQSETAWFNHPYIIINFNDCGRIPESELEKSKNLKEIPESIRANASKGMEQIISQSKISEPIFDADSNIIWMSASIKLEGAENLKVLSGMHLTEYGLLCVTCYAVESQMDENSLIFESIIKSVDITSILRYTPGSSDAPSPAAKWVWGFVCAAILIFYLTHRRGS
jgi:hypothetical protein